MLGDVGVWIGSRRVEVGHARQRCVFAVLAVEANRVVTVDQLLERVWPRDLPLRSRQVLQNYLSRLRQVLSPEGIGIERRSTGYVLLTDPDLVDLHRFRALVTLARGAGDEHAFALLGQALTLWRGEPFTGLETPWLAAVRTGLQQERLAAQLDRADVALRCGRHAEVLTELFALAEQDSLNERVAGLLVLALHQAGRTADALAHFRQVRAELVEQLGIEPGEALQNLHRRVLDADPVLTPLPTPITAERPVPRQLPAPPQWFTGRGAELARLDQALEVVPGAGPERSRTGTVVVSAIRGTGGIGKTCLALTWAHRHLDEFPDGQLFVDLHGFSPTEEPMTPAAAVRGFLSALGRDAGRIPSELDAQAALYRTLVAGRRMLVVLDNAAAAEQVVPLLPGSRSCIVLITGRTRLASLIDRHGARHLTLDVLSRAEAHALLTERVGAGRAAAEPEAVDELVELCGGYPLALSITARNAATRPTIPLAELAAELRELGLDVLNHDTDPVASLPKVLSLSLRHLTGEQRTAFALLGIAPGPDTTLPAVVALTGSSKVDARRTMAALEEASLVERRPHGRYAMHDLVRAYAAATARDLDEPVRDAALRRVVDFYLHTALAADRLLNPFRPPIEHGQPADGVRPDPLPDSSAALAWLDDHHPHLLAAQQSVVARHDHRTVWHLAWALTIFHQRRGRLHDDLAVWQAALRAADHLPDPTSRIHAHRFLGSVHTELGLHEQSIAHLHQALALAQAQDDHVQLAHTHLTLSTAWPRADAAQALDHARRALEFFRVLGQPVWEAEALNLMGWHAAHLGDHAMAHEHCEAALVLLRRHHDPHGEAAVLDTLAYADHRAGHQQQAIHHYGQALALYRSLGHSYEVANTLDNLGRPHAVLGQREQARAAWREARELFREQGRDGDADRVRRQLDELAEGPEPVTP
ncbi:BTAD domain-containing putative transcriptional regulator [Lentzea sp. BCCO 10_0061]|uniref:BTAD domain-containing putative transcriptional regulator n=1 Tax=Lentzea sokolovensis TaxID=3095429 RepID=A0ABU4VA91_9PSEU|nr:BTAD domain-containing putative transcriptional regulator [Lentzea sp. BCCO 10_0061]MDX8148720.1 BTAD domain-containing putative transcriptional regulator [Lentzea sp. BCCO 10_0061]